MNVKQIITDYIMKSILTTHGDLVVRGATIPERLAAVAVGQVLKSAGVGALPAWGVDRKIKIVNIGDWNMDTTATVTVAHGLTLTDIRSVSGLIRNDDDNSYYVISGNYAAAGTNPVGFNYIDATNVSISRLLGGTFDHANFDAVSYNRGWVTIRYV